MNFIGGYERVILPSRKKNISPRWAEMVHMWILIYTGIAGCCESFHSYWILICWI